MREILFLAMKTNEIISEIEKLTVKERLQIIEKTARTIQLDDEKEQMRNVADQLYDDYKDDVELTVFSDLDLEDFYEAR
jgi:TRAP-type C4-dicarboxylate transport system substrate-binding protein